MEAPELRANVAPANLPVAGGSPEDGGKLEAADDYIMRQLGEVGDEGDDALASDLL